MVDINNLYNSINNPLTDEVAEKLLNMYLSGQDINNYLKFQYYNEDETLTEEEEKMWMNWVLTTRDEFYSVLFNSWKDKITSKSIDEITSFINKYPQKIDNDYYQLVESMRTVPDVKSFQEINGITHNNDLIRHYWYNVLGESFWDYVKSWPLMEDENHMNTEHRLYLNTEGTDCYFMCTAFLKKCLKNKLPFDFKFDSGGTADDTIVIYSDTEHLADYVAILEEIKEENKEVVSRIHKPPILCGVIDNWIGYGSEPNYKGESFNSLREEIINTVLKEVVKINQKKSANPNVPIKSTPELISQVKRGLIIVGNRFGIDQEKFCFDVDKKDKLIKYQQQHPNKKIGNSDGGKSGGGFKA